MHPMKGEVTAARAKGVRGEKFGKPIYASRIRALSDRQQVGAGSVYLIEPPKGRGQCVPAFFAINLKNQPTMF